MSSSRGRRSSASAPALPAKDQTCLRIERMERERNERRQSMMERKTARKAEEQRNIAAGNPGDVDFIGMVRDWRSKHAKKRQPHDYEINDRICIAVRKRPVSDKERAKNDHDVITCLNPHVWVHSAKVRVDGISKYLEHSDFHFDHAFDEHTNTSTVYQCTTKPLLQFFLRGGVSTIFAFGQTGSGKSYTIQGIQALLAEDLFLWLDDDSSYLTVSFFEMYSGSIFDLLNQRNRLKVMEDHNGEIVITGLLEQEAACAADLLSVLEAGNTERTTYATEANESSSRSHALFQINLRDKRKNTILGKLSLIDLAGSERGADTRSHDSKRREESADINTSLLALKECIRSFSMGAPHVPYRQSKLTMILKDCFTSDRAMTSIIATISPGSSAAHHTVNTLRYADMTKCRRKHSKSPIRARLTPPSTSIKNDKLEASRSNAQQKPVLEDSTFQIQVKSQKKPSSTSQKVQESLPTVVISTQEDSPDLDMLKVQIKNHHMMTIQDFTSIVAHESEMVDRGSSVIAASDLREYSEELSALLDEKDALLFKMKQLIKDYRCLSKS